MHHFVVETFSGHFMGLYGPFDHHLDAFDHIQKLKEEQAGNRNRHSFKYTITINTPVTVVKPAEPIAA